MTTIECHTWANGTPVVAWAKPVSTIEDGITALVDIGDSGDFNVDFCFWLMQDDQRVAILHIYPNQTWRIERIEQAA